MTYYTGTNDWKTETLDKTVRQSDSTTMTKVRRRSYARGPTYDFFGPPRGSPILLPTITRIHIIIVKNLSGMRRTTQLDSQVSLELAEDLRTRDSVAGLIVLDDGRLLVDLLGKVLLSEMHRQTSGLNGLTRYE